MPRLRGLPGPPSGQAFGRPAKPHRRSRLRLPSAGLGGRSQGAGCDRRTVTAPPRTGNAATQLDGVRLELRAYVGSSRVREDFPAPRFDATPNPLSPLLRIPFTRSAGGLASPESRPLPPSLQAVRGPAARSFRRRKRDLGLLAPRAAPVAVDSTIEKVGCKGIRHAVRIEFRAVDAARHRRRLLRVLVSVVAASGAHTP